MPSFLVVSWGQHIMFCSLSISRGSSLLSAPLLQGRSRSPHFLWSRFCFTVRCANKRPTRWERLGDHLATCCRRSSLFALPWKALVPYWTILGRRVVPLAGIRRAQNTGISFRAHLPSDLVPSLASFSTKQIFSELKNDRPGRREPHASGRG